jgi:hypothetical protein
MADVPNPLTKFPSKRPDSTLKAYFSSSLTAINKKQEVFVDWLDPSKISSTFGIQGRGEIASIRRTYRRIESSSIFVPPNPKDALLSDIVLKSPAKKRNLVLVEASKLEEYMKYEAVLRQEKKRLEDQCLLATAPLVGSKSSPNIPVPAMRMAVHSACEQEMKEVAAAISSISGKWEAFCKINRYDRVHFISSAVHMNSIPLAMRLTKLQSMQHESAEWRLSKDRNTMMFEDDMSRLVGHYCDAQSRKVDYDRYYVLATRYGVWSEEKFYVDSTPGTRYWKMVTIGATRLQRLWGKFWMFTKMRRYHAAMRIQVLFFASV